MIQKPKMKMNTSGKKRATAVLKSTTGKRPGHGLGLGKTISGRLDEDFRPKKNQVINKSKRDRMSTGLK